MTLLVPRMLWMLPILLRAKLLLLQFNNSVSLTFLFLIFTCSLFLLIFQLLLFLLCNLFTFFLLILLPTSTVQDVFSENRKLYHAALHSPIKHVFDDVDAVDWSVVVKLIAAARDNFLIILSFEFKERLRISQPFESWVDDFDDKSTVKGYLQASCAIIL